MSRRKAREMKVLQVRVSSEEYAKLAQYAELRDTNISEVVRPHIRRIVSRIALGQPIELEEAAVA